MTVLVLDAPQAMLDGHRRPGLDGRDEMWDGVLRMVAPPGGPHQRLNTSSTWWSGRSPIGGAASPRKTGLFRSSDDHRVPGQLYCRPEHLSGRGVEGAELVVEFRSLGEETYKKVDFQSALGVPELLVLHPDGRRVELFRAEEGRSVPVGPTPRERPFRDPRVAAVPGEREAPRHVGRGLGRPVGPAGSSSSNRLRGDIEPAYCRWSRGIGWPT